MKNDTSNWATLTCSVCERAVIRMHHSQKLCRECQAARSTGKNKPNSLSIERGRAISQATRSGIAWPAQREINIVTQVRFSLPLTGAYSKNKAYSIASDGSGIVQRAAFKKIKQNIAWSTKLSVAKTKFHEGKVWLDILVQKTRPNADAVNVVDIVCDGVKLGLGIDDKWFSIRLLDWEMVKEDPRIYIGIGQEIVEPHRICRYCGQMRAQRHFATKDACIECRGIGAAEDDATPFDDEGPEASTF